MSTSTINGTPITDPSLQTQYGPSAIAAKIAANPQLQQIIQEWNSSGQQPIGAKAAFQAAGIPWNTAADESSTMGGVTAPQLDGTWKQISDPGLSTFLKDVAITGATYGLGNIAAHGGGGKPSTTSPPSGQTPEQWAQGSTTPGGGPSTGPSTGPPTGNSTSDLLNNAGKVLGAFGQGQANQRVSQSNGQLAQDDALLRAQQDRRAAETDAMKKLSETGYILGGGSTFKQPSISLNGHTYNTQGFGLGPTPISPAQKTAAQTLQDQMLARVQPGGSFTPPPLPTPGAGETIGNYGPLITSGLSLANQYFNK